MIDFDAETGRLRLTPDEFEALVEEQQSPVLAEAGALTEAGVHPLLQPGISAVQSYVCQAQLLVVGPRNSQLHQVWMSRDAAAMLMEVRDGIYDFVTISPAFLPVAFARICRLGPRRERPETDVDLPKRVVKKLWDQDDRSRGKAVAHLAKADRLSPAWRDALTEESWWGWSAAVFWDTGSAGRTLKVLDSAGGPYAFDDHSLVPASSTEIWRTLLRLFPADDELGTPS